MFNFFKRSKNRAQAQASSSSSSVNPQQSRSHAEQQACASDLWHRKIDDGNRENTIQLAATQQQYENESIGDRAPTSNSTKNSFFIDIMAKGKNRRNYGKNKQQSAYQNHQQQHNNKLKNDNTKLATAAATTPSSTNISNNNNGKQQNTVVYDGVERKRNDDKITSEKFENIEKIPQQQQQNTTSNNQSKNNQKYVKSKNIASNNNEDHEKIYCGVFNGNDDNFNNGDDGNGSSARHQNDRKNTEENLQKQYGVAAQPADSSETAANFVKGIIFEKYKRPLSPLQIRSIEVDVDDKHDNGENVLAPETAGESINLIMGQQPAKHYHNSNHHYQQSFDNREYYRKINTPPISPPASPVSSPLHTPLSSPPETPSITEQLSSQDEKDIFYEASDSSGSILVPESIKQFDFPTTTTTAILNGNAKSNCANNPKDTDTFPSVTVDNNVPIIVSFSDTNGCSSNCLVINNNNINSAAAASATEYNNSKLKIFNNKDHGDSPDSGVEIDNDNCCDTFSANHKNVTIDSDDDFKYAFNENSVIVNEKHNNSFDIKHNSFKNINGHCDDSNLVLKTNTNSNSIKNIKSNDDVHSDSFNKQQQLQKSQSKKKILVEDAVSLPDLVESTAVVVNSNMAGGGAPEDSKQNGHVNDSLHTNGYEKKDLFTQESKFTTRLEEAEKEVIKSQSKANDLACQVDELERNLTVKSWNVERIQAELQAAFKEGDCVKKKLKLQENELDKLRTKLNEAEEDFSSKYIDLESKHEELQEKSTQLSKLAMALQIQLAEAQCDASDARKDKDLCQKNHELEKKRLQDAIDAAEVERKKLEKKWQLEFEHLRTINSDREEQLLQDCEWKLRTTEQRCKAKVIAAENSKREALEKANEIETESKRQMNEVRHLKSFEAEVAQLRGLTSEQRESINSMTEQIDDLKTDLKEANKMVEDSLESVRKIKFHCEQEISDKDRQMIYKIDEARGEVAVMWEDRLLEEMARLKIELEAVYAEDRTESLQKAYIEHLDEISKLTNTFNKTEKQLTDEIAELKTIIIDRDSKLQEAKDKSDKQIMQIRVILDKSEREHQREMDNEIQKHQEALEALRLEHENDKQEMEEKFRERLTHVTEEFARELTNNKEELVARHKKQLEQQWEKLQAEKEEAIQNLERNFKRKLTDAETKFRDLEITHHREMKDQKNAYQMERSTLEQRDLQNANEIETLHRKCRCLTKLFEEMRMRYERRDPRPEDVREIQELRSRLDWQDRDLRELTEKLRELQMMQQQSSTGGSQNLRKQKPKKSKVNCDVIYEENEDRESPPGSDISNSTTVPTAENSDDDDDDENDS